MILRLAEAPNAFEPIDPGEHIVVNDRFVLFLGLLDDPSFNSVAHLRLTPDEVIGVVEQARAAAAHHGRSALTWEVASSATPPDLFERLSALGMVPSDPPMAVVMALREAPPPPPPGIVITVVETMADFRAFVSITYEASGRAHLLAEQLERIDRDAAPYASDGRVLRYLAWIDGAPVAAARATFTDIGAILHSGGTLPASRGRGAYRALVSARWSDAARRGTPLLVTRAGPMSRPILRRVGFQELAEIRFLIDRFGRPTN